MILTHPLKFFIQALFAKVRNNTLINIRFISSKLPIIAVEAGGEESWISDDSFGGSPFCGARRCAIVLILSSYDGHKGYGF